jgi:NitT/TauT family transport system ATP-binding protein
MAHRTRSPGADPSNLWGNAREGSDVSIGLYKAPKPRHAQPPQRGTERSSAESAQPAAARASDELLRGVDARAVSRAYRDGRGRAVQALDEITLHAAPGELLAVVGPSGCGKTTLLELICGLQTPDGGTLACAPAALMPQRDLLLPWLSALDNATLALRVARVPRPLARARAAELFAELGLAGFEQTRPHELSGGMRQRVAFVRTLLSGKGLLCLDEPFGALDAITRAEMQTWLAGALAAAPRTVVLVTHDVEEAVMLADRIAVLSPRPGRMLAELDVALPRPRTRTDADVVALRERILDILALNGRAA